MKKTKWEIYEELEKQFQDALLQKAEDCDISIHEAHCDKFGKEWDKFHEVEHEEFDLEIAVKTGSGETKMKVYIHTEAQIKAFAKLALKPDVQLLFKELNRLRQLTMLLTDEVQVLKGMK